MKKVYLSLGSNIGDRISNIEKAIKKIRKISKIISISSFYISEPMYFKKQPYFINCALEIETKLTPTELLERILLIEKKLGRKRKFKNGPRTIDIDIIYYEDIIINEKNLNIPHPKRLERAFVLKPILEINPKITDPIIRKKLKAILKSLKQTIIKIPKNYTESLLFLKELKPRKVNDFTTRYIKDTLKKLNDPQKKIKKIIHITGSVAKTSTAMYISKILKRIGFKTSTYISPHINDIRERIIIDGKKISKSEFYQNLKKIISKAQHIHSVFEYLTIIAILSLSKRKIDYNVVEVGMGGLNDATNVFEKSSQVFTLITTEHKKFLGKNIKQIVENKSGIIKKNSMIFVSSLNRKKTIDIISKKATKLNSKIFTSPKFKTKDFEEYNFFFSKWIVEKLTKKKVSIDFFKLNLPGRNQIIKHNKKEIIIDGAHTPISVRRFLNNINEEKYPICLCSFMRDKDYIKCIKEILKKGFKKIIITKSLSPRSFNPYTLKVNDKRIIIEENIEKAFYKALRLGNTVICGSLYLAGDINSIVKKRKNIHLPELI